MNINKKRKSFLLLGLFCLLLSYLYASFDVPITYQGTVTKPGGSAPANDNYAMRFSLWNVEAGGTDIDNLKWSESFVGDNKVKISDSVFVVELGKVTSFSENLFKENEKLWIQVEVDLDGNGFEVISPRELLSAVPYAFISNQAYSADYASKAGLAEKAKTLEGYSLSDILASKEPLEIYWRLSGNEGTTPGTDFLGTTDNQALEVKVNNTRAMRIEPTTKGANIIEGYKDNAVTSSVYSAAIGGGGSAGWVNKVTDNYGTVGGGTNNLAGDNAGTTSDRPYATVGGGYTNTAKGYASTVPGGYWNIASGTYSFAAGRRARASHTGTFVWADSTDADFISTGVNQFLIRASGGVGIGTASPKAKLDVQGNATISGAIQIGASEVPVSYNRIGSGIPDTLIINSPSDLLISGDLEVKGDVKWYAEKTRAYAMNATDFGPYRNSYVYYRALSCLFKTSGETNAQVWWAPVHLPDDAEVTILTVWYYDNTDSGDIRVELSRKVPSDISSTTMAIVASSGTPGAAIATDNSIDDAVISNFGYTYGVSVTFPAADTGNNLQLRAVRITYHIAGQ